MVIKGQVLNASVEDRQMTAKDGTKRSAKISHVLLSVGEVGKNFEIVNIRSYDATWKLPKVGDVWETPPIRRYENFDGQVADVTC